MRIHFLRLESPVNASPKNRRLIMTYGDYGEKRFTLMKLLIPEKSLDKK
jgi:hypothetical protein